MPSIRRPGKNGWPRPAAMLYPDTFPAGGALAWINS
jgi:hypothetical protein